MKDSLLILCATKCEAAPLISQLGLIKSNDGTYRSDLATLLITGIGMETTQSRLTQVPLREYSRFVNVGVCGAKSAFRIGELFEVSNVISAKGDTKYSLMSAEGLALTTSPSPVSASKIESLSTELVDMEAFGIVESLLQAGIANNSKELPLQILKVVSDHGVEQEEFLDKNSLQQLIVRALPEILKRMKK